MHIYVRYTFVLGEVELDGVARKDPSGDEANVVPRLEESEVSVNHEEEEAGEHYGGVADANMKHEEEDKENVEVMCVEEELKHSFSNPWKCGSP